jgi:hypothetical protein
VALLSVDRPPGCAGSPNSPGNPDVLVTLDTSYTLGRAGGSPGRAVKHRSLQAPKPESPEADAGSSEAAPDEVPQERGGSLVAILDDLAADVTAEDLMQEVVLLRGVIRRLAEDDDKAESSAEDVRILAELRHQVVALCGALKVQKALSGQAGDALAAELEQALDDLHDGLGVPR